MNLKKAGSQVPAGRYVCADCGHALTLQTDAVVALPPCRNVGSASHVVHGWHRVDNGARDVDQRESGSPLRARLYVGSSHK